ncbi:MAG: cytochrome c-type biogenesis protein CcmH [Deltaproteobacteria bacterium]
MRTFFAIVAMLLVSSSAFAAADGDPSDLARRELGVSIDNLPNLSPEQDDYAKAIGQDVVCLCGTCPRHTVTNCQCGWAHENKKVIRAALVAGKTKEQIIAAYEKAYGLKVRPTPPDEGFGKLSYMLPYAAIVFGLGLVLVLGLKMRKRGASSDAVATAAQNAPGEDVDDEARSILEQELDELDR